MNRTDPDGMQDAPVTSSLQRDPHFRYQDDRSGIPWFLDFRPRVNPYDGKVARGLPADSLSGAFNAGARGATSKAIKDGLIVRLRHYTSNQGLTGIQQSNVIRAGDKGRVFNESANKRPLSRVDAESTYGLKPGHGRNYVEYNANLGEVLVEKNPLTRVTEHNIKGDVDLAGRVASFTKRK